MLEKLNEILDGSKDWPPIWVMLLGLIIIYFVTRHNNTTDR